MSSLLTCRLSLPREKVREWPGLEEVSILTVLLLRQRLVTTLFFFFLISYLCLSDSLRPPWTVACQAPLSMGFPRQHTGVGCHFLLQGIFPT